MTAKKENKEYTIFDAERKVYEAKGFDIYDDDGNLLSYGKGKTVPFEKYAAVMAELEKIRSEKDVDATKMESDQEDGSVDDLAGMTADELRAYAESNGIDIGQATTQVGIMAKIKAAKAE